jgi:hypothetical protein
MSWRSQQAIVAALAGFAFCRAVPAYAANQSVEMEASIDDHQIHGSNDQHPVRLNPDRPAKLSLRITNPGIRPAKIVTVRLEGKVIGLTFFAYDTSVGITVPARSDSTLVYFLDLADLGGQARGLITGSVKAFDTRRTEVASEPLVMDVRGSLRSVYGLFGLALAALTIYLFIVSLTDLARHRLPPNRWKRGLHFMTPGVGLGLSVVFSLSALRFFAPQPGRWIPIVGIATVVFFLLGYLTPSPELEEEEEDGKDQGAESDQDPLVDAQTEP